MATNFRSNVYEGGLTVDPTAGAGVAAQIGSILPQRSTGRLWRKFAAGATAWQVLGNTGDLIAVTNAMSPYTILRTDGTLLVNTTAGAVNIQLPSPAVVGAGFQVRVLDAIGLFSTNNAVLIPFAAELVEGLNANKPLSTAWGGWTIFTDATNWFLF